MNVYSVGVCNFDKKDSKYYEDLLIKDIVRVQGSNQVVIKIGYEPSLSLTDEVSLYYDTNDNLLNTSPVKLITKNIRPLINPALSAPTSANLVDFLKKIKDGYIPVCVSLKFNADDTCVVNKFTAIGYLDDYSLNNFMKMANTTVAIGAPKKKEFVNFAEIDTKDVTNFVVVAPNTSLVGAISNVASSAGDGISSAVSIIKRGVSSAGSAINSATNRSTRKSNSTTKLCEFVKKVIDSKNPANIAINSRVPNKMSMFSSLFTSKSATIPPTLSAIDTIIVNASTLEKCINNIDLNKPKDCDTIGDFIFDSKSLEQMFENTGKQKTYEIIYPKLIEYAINIHKILTGKSPSINLKQLCNSFNNWIENPSSLSKLKVELSKYENLAPIKSKPENVTKLEGLKGSNFETNCKTAYTIVINKIFEKINQFLPKCKIDYFESRFGKKIEEQVDDTKSIIICKTKFTYKYNAKSNLFENQTTQEFDVSFEPTKIEEMIKKVDKYVLFDSDNYLIDSKRDNYKNGDVIYRYRTIHYGFTVLENFSDLKEFLEKNKIGKNQRDMKKLKNSNFLIDSYNKYRNKIIVEFPIYILVNLENNLSDNYYEYKKNHADYVVDRIKKSTIDTECLVMRANALNNDKYAAIDIAEYEEKIKGVESYLKHIDKCNASVVASVVASDVASDSRSDRGLDDVVEQSEYEQKISVMREQFDNASKMQTQTNAFIKKGKNSAGIELEYIVDKNLIDNLFKQTKILKGDLNKGEIENNEEVDADMDRLTEIVCDTNGITRYTKNLHLILTGKKPGYSKSKLCKYMNGDENYQYELEKMRMTMFILPDADITAYNYKLIKKGDKVKGPAPNNTIYTINKLREDSLMTDVVSNGSQVILTSPNLELNDSKIVSTQGFKFVSYGIVKNTIKNCIETYNYIVTKIVDGIEREMEKKFVVTPDPKPEVVAAAPEPKTEVDIIIDQAFTLEKCLNNKFFGKPEDCIKVENPFLTKDQIEPLNYCEKLFEYAETMYLIITGKKTGCNKNYFCQNGNVKELKKLLKTKFLDNAANNIELDKKNHNLLKVGDQISIDAGGVLCDIKKIDNKTIKIIDKNGNKYEYNLTTGNITNRDVDFTDKKPTGGRLINSVGNHEAFFIKSGNISSENSKNLDAKFNIQTCIDTYNLVVDQIEHKYFLSKYPLSMQKSNKDGIVGGLKRNFAVQTAIPRIYRQVLEVHKTAERRTDYYNYA